MPERPRPATRPAPRPADGSASLPPLPLPLAREAVDRAGLEREVPGLLDRLWQEAGTEVLHLRGGRAPVRDGALVTVSPAGPLPSGAVFLGRRERAEGQAPAAVVLVAHEDGAGAGSTPEPSPGPLPADMAWVGLRDVAAGLSDADAGLFTAAVSVTHWHASHGFCPRCGGPTAVESAGWVRRCTACSAQHFPRTDPAVIMAVTDDDDRLLLGSNAAWPAGRHSCLAGFVEPGESLEHAVVREVGEEAGIVVVDPVYRGSQPWPFPRSLMVGFRARAPRGQTDRADGVEIRSLRWFSRAELVAAVRDGEVTLPGAVSIARALIEDWYGGTLPDETTLIS